MHVEGWGRQSFIGAKDKEGSETGTVGSAPGNEDGSLQRRWSFQRKLSLPATRNRAGSREKSSPDGYRANSVQTSWSEQKLVWVRMKVKAAGKGTQQKQGNIHYIHTCSATRNSKSLKSFPLRTSHCIQEKNPNSYEMRRGVIWLGQSRMGQSRTDLPITPRASAAVVSRLPTTLQGLSSSESLYLLSSLHWAHFLSSLDCWFSLILQVSFAKYLERPSLRPPSKQPLQSIAITKYLVHICIALLTGLANPPHEGRGTLSALCTPCVQCLAEFLV